MQKTSAVPSVEISSTHHFCRFGDLAAQEKRPQHASLSLHTEESLFPGEDMVVSEAAENEEEPPPMGIRTAVDHHLRLSRTDRAHEPNWYLGRINRLCQAGNTQAALHMFFVRMLTRDRVMPDRNLIHVLLSGLASVGDSDSAFKVYRKMTELGIPATQSTYSRLFKACAEDIAAWQRQHRYEFRALPNSYRDQAQTVTAASQISASYAGPALERVRNLWQSLHDRGFRMNRVTYNTLLFALAKGGDLRSCFQALDAMLGVGGLPEPMVPMDQAPNKADPLPPFRPDQYTLTAVLTAVQSAYNAGVIGSSLEAMTLSLQLWHVLVPRLRDGPSQHHFTLLAGVLGLNDQQGVRKLSLPISPYRAINAPTSGDGGNDNTAIHILPDRLPRLPVLPTRASATNPRLLASQKAASQLLREFRDAALNPSAPLPLLSSQASAPSCSPSFSLPSSSASNNSPQDPVPSPASVITVDWDDENLVLQSPVNLLKPLPEGGVRVPLSQALSSSKPRPHHCLSVWQKLILVGGLDGLLECMETHFKVPVTAPPLFTKLVALLPPPSSTAGTDSTEGLDRWEQALLKAMQRRNVALDLPVFNALLLRRTNAGEPANQLMALGSRSGLTPDEFTWGCLARTCRNSQSVKDFLRAYAKAAAAAATTANRTLPLEDTSPTGSSRSLARSRPGLHIYAALLAVTTFNWDAKIVILRSMLGPRRTPPPPPPTPPSDSAASSATSSSSSPPPSPQSAFPDAICPNRRVVANLELEIARYRALVARGVVPKDNSSVAACDETGGVIIPPYSLRAFKRFIPVYKSWALASTPETAQEYANPPR
ncbi:U4/U6-U5 snRNP complex subunit lsm8 [Sparganum proliferum]